MAWHYYSRLTVIFIASFVLVGCDGGTGLRGFVRDPNGMPVAGATITMSPDGDSRKHEVLSAQDGTYSITMLHEPGRDVVVRVVKQGYGIVERRFHSHGEVLHENFTLQPDRPTS
jgi:hypothetical protein